MYQSTNAKLKLLNIPRTCSVRFNFSQLFSLAASKQPRNGLHVCTPRRKQLCAKREKKKITWNRLQKKQTGLNATYNNKHSACLIIEYSNKQYLSSTYVYTNLNKRRLCQCTDSLSRHSSWLLDLWNVKSGVETSFYV